MRHESMWEVILVDCFLIRTDPKLLEELKDWSTTESRSLNAHIVYLLQQALQSRPKNSPAVDTMETQRHLRQETVHALQNLIRLNLDSYKNLSLVLEATSDEMLTALFREIADQRKEFAMELGVHVFVNDGDLSPNGHFLEELHRWWFDLTGKLERGNVQVVLEEAARGEAALEAAYGRIMTERTGSAVSDVLDAQYKAINESSRRIYDLLDKVKNG